MSSTSFPDAGQTPGIEIWRVEQLQMAKWTDLGQFHSGDSYLILHTIQVGVKYDLYYWLGESSTSDEKGVAAFKAVELDQQLGDVPVQYRECQK